jgi:hypothetical protein
MQKILLVFLFNLLYFFSHAQKEIKFPAAQYVRISAKDSLVILPESVKKQVSRLLPAENKPNGNLRFMLSISNKTDRINTSRWIAARQKKDMYQVNLSGLVSKYIGETEKNLEKVFNQAATLNCILFFDEADALFGKRTEPGSTEDQARKQALEYFIKKMAACKDIVLVSCTGEDCLGKLAALSFIKIGS